MIKDVMVRLDGTPADDARLAAVNQIAEYFDGHVVGLFLNVLPLLLPPDGDTVAAAETVRVVDQARVIGDERETGIRQRLARLQKPVELRRLDVFGDSIGQTAVREARTADVFVAIQPNGVGREPEQLIESVLFEAGRHLFLVPERMAATPAFRNVMIVWNGSREATRAVSEAMSYLRKADTVGIVIVEEDEPVEEQATLGRNLAEHLLHHGVGATLRRVAKNGHIGSALIAESSRLGADLIVMGGYGHSRLREWLLGGTTHQMVHDAAVPLVIAH